MKEGHSIVVRGTLANELPFMGSPVTGLSTVSLHILLCDSVFDFVTAVVL